MKFSQFEGFWLEATVAHIIAGLCVCEFIGWMAAAKFPSNMGFNVCNHDMSYWILAWVGLASNLLLCLYRVRASVRVIENIEFQNTSAKSILNRAEANLILKQFFFALDKFSYSSSRNQFSIRSSIAIWVFRIRNHSVLPKLVCAPEWDFRIGIKIPKSYRLPL